MARLVYKATRTARYFGLATGTACCFGTFAALYWVMAAHGWRERVFWLIASIFSAALGICLFIAPFKQRVILDPEAIEAIGVFRIQRMAQQEIGARMRVPANWPTWAILPKIYGQPKVTFEMSYDFDKVFLDWFDTIPIANDAFFKSWKEQRRSKSKSIS